MNESIISLIFNLLLIVTCLQSVELEVISDSGDYFEGINASLSLTPGELVKESLDNRPRIYIQEFQ